jgi:hypothetical protein
MLTGSVASSFYGVPRSTHDVDFVIAPTKDQLLAFVVLCKRHGLYATNEEATAALQARTQFNVIDFANGLKADLIIRKMRDFSVVEFDRRSEVDLPELSLVIATAEDVLIAKLEWAKIGESELQLDDAAGMIRMQGHALDLPYVERWVESLGLQEQWQLARERAL